MNGTFLWSPIVKGFGTDIFSPKIVDVVRDTYNWSGRAVLLGLLSNGKSPEANVRNTIQKGLRLGYGMPTAVLIQGGLPYAGFATYTRDNSNMESVQIPVIEVSLRFWILVTVFNNVTAGEGALMPVTVVIRDDDRSPLENDWPFSAVLVSATVMTALCLACFAVNIYKFQKHIRHTDGLTIPKLYFLIDNVANFMRFWYVCVNPFFVNQFAYTWTTICTTTHMALTIICTLLLSLKWQELLQRTMVRATMFLSKFKWPFIVTSLIIFAVEFVSSTMRGHWYSLDKLPVISWSFLVVAGFIVCLLLFISGTQILWQISSVTLPSSGRIWQLNRATIFILGSGVCLLAWCMTEMVFLIRTYRLHKVTLLATNLMTALQFVFLCLCSLLQSWAMPIPSLPYTPPNAPTPSSAALMDSAASYRPGVGTMSGKDSVTSPESMISLGSTWNPASSHSMNATDASTTGSSDDSSYETYGDEDDGIYDSESLSAIGRSFGSLGRGFDDTESS